MSREGRGQKGDDVVRSYSTEDISYISECRESGDISNCWGRRHVANRLSELTIPVKLTLYFQNFNII